MNRRILLSLPLLALSNPSLGQGKLRAITFGDSLSDTLYLGIDFTKIFDLARFGKQGTGLINPRHTSWLNNSINRINNTNFDYLFILFGGNDIKDVEGGIVWRENYKRRVDTFLANIEQRRKIIWVGLPPYEDIRSDFQSMLLNRIYRSSVESVGANFIDIRSSFLDENDRYPQEINFNGSPRTWRHRDGTHFTSDGAKILGINVLAKSGFLRF